MGPFHFPRRTLLAAALIAVAGRRLLNAPYRFEGKTVLITGARGLALAIARELSPSGCNFTLMSRTASELERAKAELEKHGNRVLTVQGDVTRQEDIERALRETELTFGGLDVLANVAGVIQNGPLENITEEDFRHTMEVNAFAPLRFTRAALPYLRARRGRVLIVSSLGGKVAVPHLSSYTMSKFAVTGAGKALRAELAREGVGVTVVLPGLMQTGSPRNATVKGQHAREYAFFATADNLPLVSLDAQEAARRIVSALSRNDAEAMIGVPALLMRYAEALAPQLLADAMSLTNRLLPGPSHSNEAKLGKEAESPLTLKNPIKREAERRFNERG